MLLNTPTIQRLSEIRSITKHTFPINTPKSGIVKYPIRFLFLELGTNHLMFHKNSLRKSTENT